MDLWHSRMRRVKKIKQSGPKLQPCLMAWGLCIVNKLNCWPKMNISGQQSRANAFILTMASPPLPPQSHLSLMDRHMRAWVSPCIYTSFSFHGLCTPHHSISPSYYQSFKRRQINSCVLWLTFFTGLFPSEIKTRLSSQTNTEAGHILTASRLRLKKDRKHFVVFYK